MSDKKIVLVVDDSVTTRDFVSAYLNEAGFDTEQAPDGVKALELIKANTYDCYVIDLLMPEMSGFELLEKLKELNDTTPTIVVTADIQEEVKEECLALGANDFINKPVLDPQVIISSINKIIN